MEFYTLLDYLILTVSLIGVAIILWGVVLVLRDFLINILSDDPAINRSLRQKLGAYLILGLEFFIAADIIRTITRPDWNDIGMLAAIILLRTVLSFFLGLELKEKS